MHKGQLNKVVLISFNINNLIFIYNRTDHKFITNLATTKKTQQYESQFRLTQHNC